MDPCATCTLWKDDTMCEIQDCGVCNCERPDFISEQDVADSRESDTGCQQQLNSQKLIHMPTNNIFSKPWATSVEAPKMEVVNLLANPEVYTGYQGSKVWVCFLHCNRICLRKLTLHPPCSHHLLCVHIFVKCVSLFVLAQLRTQFIKKLALNQKGLIAGASPSCRSVCSIF